MGDEFNENFDNLLIFFKAVRIESGQIINKK